MPFFRLVRELRLPGACRSATTEKEGSALFLAFGPLLTASRAGSSRSINTLY